MPKVYPNILPYRSELPLEKALPKASVRAPISDTLTQAPLPPPRFSITKPVLEGPPQYRVMATLSQLWKNGDNRLNYHLLQLEQSEKNLQELDLEQAKNLKEAAEKSQESQFWSLLRRIGSCILAAITMALGISLLTAGGAPIAAGLLISSGILSLANLAFSEAGIWNDIAGKLFPEDEEKRKKFLVFVPGAIGVVAAVLGMAGSVGGASVLEAGKAADRIKLITVMAANFAKGIATIGESVTEGRVLLAQERAMGVTKDLFVHQKQFEKITGGMKSVMQLLSDTYRKASLIITTSIKTGEEITLKG